MSDTDTAAPMRLRAESPRVTRLSRKMLAGVGAVALLGIGGALIYALQTRDAGSGGDELYSTENRPTADGLSGLPSDYSGPALGPALDLPWARTQRVRRHSFQKNYQNTIKYTKNYQNAI